MSRKVYDKLHWPWHPDEMLWSWDFVRFLEQIRNSIQQKLRLHKETIISWNIWTSRILTAHTLWYSGKSRSCWRNNGSLSGCISRTVRDARFVSRCLGGGVCDKVYADDRAKLRADLLASPCYSLTLLHTKKNFARVSCIRMIFLLNFTLKRNSIRQAAHSS